MDYMRVYLLGSRGVGKSALIVRYLTHTFLSGYSKETVVYTIEGDLSNFRQIHLTIHDIADPEIESMTIDASFTGVTVFAFIYAINDEKSFQYVKDLIDLTAEAKNCLRAQIILVGCKCDLDHAREVPKSKVNKLSRKLSALSFEVSACSGEGVETLFDSIIREIYNSRSTSFRRRYSTISLAYRCLATCLQ